MPLQYINEMLGLPEIQIIAILSLDAKEIHIAATPTACKQACPGCHSEQFVKRDGSNTPRKIRHLAVFGLKSYVPCAIDSVSLLTLRDRIR